MCVANAEEAIKAVANICFHQGRWCLPDRRVSRIIGNKWKEEVDGSTTVENNYPKGRNHATLSGLDIFWKAWFDLYRRLHRRVFSHSWTVQRSTVSPNQVRGYKTGLLREHLDAPCLWNDGGWIFLLIGTNDIGKEIPQKGNLRQCRSGLTSSEGLSAAHQLMHHGESRRALQTKVMRTSGKNSGPNQAYHNWQAYHRSPAILMCIRLC